MRCFAPLAVFVLAFAVLIAAAGTAIAVETIHVGEAIRTGGSQGGGVYIGFPDFLKVEDTNATTRAWNLNGSDQTLNSVSVIGTGSTNSGAGGLTIFNNPNSYASGFLNWSGDPQQAAKNDISQRGRWTGAPSSWAVDITATPGQLYELQLLSNPVGGGNNRSLDVLVDGVLFADDLWVPGDDPFSVVYKFPVTADADGIDITFAPGADYDANPWITAIGVTEATAIVPEPSTLALATLGALALALTRRRRKR